MEYSDYLLLGSLVGGIRIPLKNMSSSIGMMTFPSHMEKTCSKLPTRSWHPSFLFACHWLEFSIQVPNPKPIHPLPVISPSFSAVTSDVMHIDLIEVRPMRVALVLPGWGFEEAAAVPWWKTVINYTRWFPLRYKFVHTPIKLNYRYTIHKP